MAKSEGKFRLLKGPYDPLKTEKEILEFWQKGKYNKPEYDPKRKETFCIIMPPPNANARPHLGNISGYSYQDLMGRYNRMKGKKVLLFPGKDHAGIQTEAVFEREVLAPKGKTKMDLGREEFYKQCYEYSTNCAKQARADEERVGISADFDRDIFTLDPKIVEIILETFIKLYKDKLVYKGIRITNWCPKCQTALADADTERKKRKSTLIYIKYNGVTIATTRPETMLADTAIAVNPKDKRYKDLIGKTVTVPLVNREVLVITDAQVDLEVGTGALKVTPAHAPEDYDIMLRWNEENPDSPIDYINVIWKDGKLYGPVGKYKGMTIEEAQNAVISDLEAEGRIEKVEESEQNVSVCERCKSVIEPIMSSQWYIQTGDMRKKAIDAVKNGDVKIHPKFMEKMYFNWMESLRDWPISRSLWWGYRFPVWYKGEKKESVDENGKIIETVSNAELDVLNSDQLKVQIESPGEGWIQDEDVFDTWFSSGQWPFAVLTQAGLLDEFYPTQVIETAYDILATWVSRMIMLGIYRTGKAPFKDVYLHGLLRAADGQKMSKSKGNVISMDDVVNEHGADTLRLFYYSAGKAGGSYNFDWERIKHNRNFLNKMWNASRFVLMHLKDADLNSEAKLAPEDEKALGMVEDLRKKVSSHIEKFRFNLAVEAVMDSFWHTFCDEYIEATKDRLYSEGDSPEKAAAQQTLNKVLKGYLKILHPFVPFITEALWQRFNDEDDSETIMYAEV